MMSDAVLQRYSDVFWATMKDFSEFNLRVFPKCAVFCEWDLWLNTVIGDDPKQRRKTLEKWYDAMHAPLVTGCAKYMKAVASITGSPAMVYHAVYYSDANAVHASVPMFVEIDLPGKMSSGVSPEDKTQMWKTYKDLYHASCMALGRAIPTVPTSEDIAADIAKRRECKETLTPNTTLSHNLRDVIGKLLLLRGKNDAVAEGVAVKLSALNPAQIEALRVASMADPPDAACIMGLCTELGSEDYADGAQRETLRSLSQLLSMNSNIPTGMMKGIEEVAASLMKDVESGNVDINKLDIDAIGRRVLSGVSPTDIADFSNNIESLLPILSAGMGKK